MSDDKYFLDYMRNPRIFNSVVDGLKAEVNALKAWQRQMLHAQLLIMRKIGVDEEDIQDWIVTTKDDTR